MEQSDAAESPAGEALTLANAVHNLVRNDILALHLAPGTKLALDRMCRRYGIGSSPMREALTRLAEEGLVERRDNRGFAVAGIDSDGFSEIMETRCWAEARGVAESIARGGRDWEDALILAHHRLARHPRPAGGAARKADPAAMRLHGDFHSALVAACGSRWLVRFCGQLADQAHRHRLGLTGAGARIAAREHEAILKAALARDAKAAADLLVAHHRATLEETLRKARPASKVMAARRQVS